MKARRELFKNKKWLEVHTVEGADSM